LRGPLLIKRVLAVPGDRMTMRSGRIDVNGRPVPASYPPLHPDYDLSIASYHFIVDRGPLDPAFRRSPAAFEMVGSRPASVRMLRRRRRRRHQQLRRLARFGCAELRGTFSGGLVRGKPTALIGKVVKILHGRQP
jgi:hypothetical protein